MTEQNETKKYTWLEIRKQGIEVHFQPIYNIADRRITALEALFRACDGNGGYLNSEQVVQDIEAEGHSYALDCWVIDQTCAYMQEFRKRGIKRVNVNLSPASFVSHRLAQKITYLMDEHEIPHHMLWLELTECGGDIDPELIKQAMEELQEEGFMFSMDDFGKGESNFLRLLDYDFDVLKVDKEFVWSIEEKEKGKAALSCVIDFAKGQNMMVTAEGVETQAHVDFLKKAGVNNLQGYLISKPLDPKACMVFLEKYQHVDILEVIKKARTHKAI